MKKTMVMVTLHPEWEPELEKLKREQFCGHTQAEMLRYIISRGLESLKTEKKSGSPQA